MVMQRQTSVNPISQHWFPWHRQVYNKAHHADGFLSSSVVIYGVRLMVV